MKPMNEWGSAEIADYSRNPSCIIEPFGVTPSQGTPEVERQEAEYRPSFIRTYWLACLLCSLIAACAIALPDYWVAMDWGACEAEGC